MTTRNESVRLSLIDAGFSTGMAKAAAAAALLDGQLDDLDGRQINIGSSARQASDDIDGLSGSLDRNGDAISRNSRALSAHSSRMGLIAKTLGAFGPTLAPLGAVGAAGIGALTSQLTFAAFGMTSLIVASRGVGDALKAVNEAAIEPTAENLEKAREAMRELDPAAQAFVQRFQEFRPVLRDIRDSAQAGWFPGLTESLDDFERVAPKIATIFEAIGEVGGNLVADAAESLAGPEWSEFMDFIAREAPPAFDTMGRAIGNVVQGIGELVMAFDPLNDDFGSWILDGARGFNEWAAGLSQTEGFAEFVAYVRENGPKVADAVVAIGNAFLQIGEAAAPLAGPILESITSLADALAAVADSPVGTPIMAAVTAISALSLASTVATGSVTRLGVALGGLGAAGSVGSAASFAKGGPLGLILAGIALQAMNVEDQIKETERGTQGFLQGLLESTLPGVKAFDLLKGALDGTDNAADRGLGALERYQARVDAISVSLRRARPPASRLASALAQQRAAAEAGAKAFIDLSTSMKPKNFDLGKWISQLERQADALRNFRINAQRAAERGLRRGLIAELQRLGPEGAVQLKHLADASEREIRRANAAWRSIQAETRRSRAEIRATGDEIQRVGRLHPKPKIDADISGAQNGVASVERLLTGIHGREAHTYVYTHHITTRTVNTSPGFGPVEENADGGTIGGQRFPYRDKVLSWLAPGEEVISNRFGQADRHRDLLKAINANRFAAGGTVPLRSRGSGGVAGTQTVRVQVEILPGDLDLRRLKAQIDGRAHAVAADVYDQRAKFAETQR